MTFIVILVVLLTSPILSQVTPEPKNKVTFDPAEKEVFLYLEPESHPVTDGLADKYVFFSKLCLTYI
jgi:hypothetical protein